MKKKPVNAALASRVNAIVARQAKLSPNARLPKAERRRWYNFVKKAAADSATDLFIYDEISSWWGVSANDFVGDLQLVETKTLNLYINSPGGSVFEGFAIYSALIRWATQNSATINVIVDGWAASIASVIAMAGDTIKISQLASVMIHEPWGGVMGTADDMRAEAAVLDDISATIVEIYAARTNADPAEIGDWMAAETWFKGQAAVDAGFADEMIPLKTKPGADPAADPDGDDGEEQDRAKLAASADADYFATIFKNLPQDIRDQLGATAASNSSDARGAPAAAGVKTPREFEDFLRDNGFSSNAAKSIASNGFKPKAEPRDGAAQDEEPTITELRDGAVKRDEALAAIRAASIAASVQNMTHTPK